MPAYFDPIIGQVTIQEPVFVRKADMTEADLDVAGRLNPQIASGRRFKKKIQGLPDLLPKVRTVSIHKDNPYHDPATGEFTDQGGPAKAVSTKSWGMESHIGTRVKVDDANNEHHGKTGRVLRQIGHSHAVELDGGKTEWLNSGQLKEIVKA